MSSSNISSESRKQAVPKSGPPNTSEQSESVNESSSKKLALVPSTSHQVQAPICNAIERPGDSRFRNTQARMSLFAISALTVWRKSRAKVKLLTGDLNKWQNEVNHNQMKLFEMTSLYQEEKTRNSDLNLELKTSREDLSLQKSSTENLATEIISHKVDLEVLEHEIKKIVQDIAGLNMKVERKKTEISTAKQIISELEDQVSSKKNSNQELLMSLNDLQDDVDGIQKKIIKAAKEYTETVESKVKQHCEILQKIDTLKVEFNHLKNKEPVLNEIHETESKLREERDVLLIQLKELKQRVRSRWSKRFTFPFPAAMPILHWIIFCLLPATPPPKYCFPICRNVTKLISALKR